ncbi:MAG: hypothetical protein HC825_01175 [Oscillatoriales cyanobacterium RM1_1_9]|nr:hypothetical protein [Oscillatoriales cyanobacterium SM2_3_0]NJO46102.1 hypothetical protein [Oscillatoriales cyanobacterium RM2_1_1]NJO70693.1 hypothetical protein [Oscillatoriales cyanobacterium RM1_1_9]
MTLSQTNTNLKKSRVWTVAHVAVLVVTLGSIVGAVLAVGYGGLQFFRWATSPRAVSPTSIPWITSERDCQRSNRAWKDGQCWDAQHDYHF